MHHRIDLRSDTVTLPTSEMRRAMAEAEVGDDVYGEDPTIGRLEEMAAARLGKEAGLFLPSGTMANQVAVMTHCARGDEVLVEAEAHVYFYEPAAIAVLSGAQPRPIPGHEGVLEVAAIAAALRPPNIHFPRTALLCLENTHNRSGGRVFPLEKLRAACDFAHGHDIAVHLDGARIFNAATATGTPAQEIAAGADSVMFCLSKGLACPVGSVLCGTRSFIERARRNRKILGGGMRQAGILAAAGIVALETMVDRLAEDHANARRLAAGLAAVAGLEVDPAAVETNMVVARVSAPGLTAAGAAQRITAAGVLVNATGPQTMRFVTHKDVSAPDIDEALGRIARALAG